MVPIQNRILMLLSHDDGEKISEFWGTKGVSKVLKRRGAVNLHVQL